MALQLMKIAVSALASVDVNPTVERYFYINPALVTAGNNLTIASADFFADDGTPLGALGELPNLTTNNSYFNVFVNGVLQMRNLSTYTPGGTGVGQLVVPATGGDIIVGTPVVLEVVNYAATADLDIET